MIWYIVLIGSASKHPKSYESNRLPRLPMHNGNGRVLVAFRRITTF
jgi:hypothetical protein